jgi:hypothetical protein
VSTRKLLISRLTRLYPFFFAAVPILHMAAGNVSKYRSGDLLFVLGSSLAACGLLYALVALMLRVARYGPTQIAPLIVLVPVLAFFNYRTSSRWIVEQLGHPLCISIGLLVSGTIIAWLARRPSYLDKLNTFLTLSATFIVVVSVSQIVAGEFHARHTIERSSLVEQLARPIRPGRPIGAGSERGPDIYLIVMDQHANSSVLREVYGFDNHAFEDSLRRLGFTIPAVVWSNYARTTLSLPSLLNAAHLAPLEAELGPSETNVGVADYLVENNRAVPYLHQQGYRFVFFPSQWWPSTHRNSHADVTFRAWSGLSLDHAIARSHLGRKLRPTTLLGFTNLGSNHADADFLRRTLEGIKNLPGSAGPIFAFAHVLSPHTPWVFDRSCGTVTGPRIRPPPFRNADRRRAYIEQVQCIDSLVLDVVQHLLKHSAHPPVILLQGDHGSNLLEYEKAGKAERVSPAQARERFGAFGAYYLPEGGAKLFGDTTTVVNVLRHVLAYYAGADLPVEPDDLYMSLEQRPFAFSRVDPRSLASPGGNAALDLHPEGQPRPAGKIR